MPRSYSRSPLRSGKSDRKDKHTTRYRSRSKSTDYDKYHTKESDKHRRRDRSKSRSIAASSSYSKNASYRSRSRNHEYKETSRNSPSRYQRRKSSDRSRYHRTSSSSSSSSSSTTGNSRSSESDTSSQSSRNSFPNKLPKKSPEKKYVFKSLEAACEDQSEKVGKLQKLDADEFIPQTFVSSRNQTASNSTVPSNIVIDLETQTLKVPAVEKAVSEDDPIFHPAFFPEDESERMARWVKKLHNLRQTLV